MGPVHDRSGLANGLLAVSVVTCGACREASPGTSVAPAPLLSVAPSATTSSAPSPAVDVVSKLGTVHVREGVRYALPSSAVTFVLHEPMRATLVSGEHVSGAKLEIWQGPDRIEERLTSTDPPLGRAGFTWDLSFCDMETATLEIRRAE